MREVKRVSTIPTVPTPCDPIPYSADRRGWVEAAFPFTALRSINEIEPGVLKDVCEGVAA